MTISNYYLEPANYATDFAALREVRNLVFVVEQQIPPEVEFDEFDGQCHHFLARDLQGQPIGTGRLSPEGKLGRLAVVREWRHQGVGQSLVRIMIEKARQLGLTTMTASAQLAVLDFYTKLGFTPVGAVFTEAGIPHQTVTFVVQPLETTARIPLKPRRPSVEAMRLDDLEATAVATQQLILQSRRQVCIYSRELDRALYGNTVIVEALKQFAIHHRNGSGVQILIQDPSALHRQRHPVIELAQRLPSHFLIRSPIEAEDLQSLSAFVVNDCDGYLFRLQDNRYEGYWSPHLPARNRQLQEEFDNVWQRSRPCTEFRALGI